MLNRAALRGANASSAMPDSMSTTFLAAVLPFLVREMMITRRSAFERTRSMRPFSSSLVSSSESVARAKPISSSRSRCDMESWRERMVRTRCWPGAIFSSGSP